jgi:hypothetical protein
MLKFVLYGLAALLALVLIIRMIGSPTSGEDAGTDALVTRLIEDDPLIAPSPPPAIRRAP